jgi:hypothetical protein
MLCRNLTNASCVMFTIAMTSIHLVNVSIAMNKNMNHHGALGKVPPLLTRDGATYLKRTKLRSESHHMRSGASWVLSDGRGCRASKEPHHAGPHPAGRNNKHHASSAQKVLEHRTPKPFKSGLRWFSPSTRMDDTIPPRDSNLLH